MPFDLSDEEILQRPLLRSERHQSRFRRADDLQRTPDLLLALQHYQHQIPCITTLSVSGRK